ncbi:hypothetical protein Acr_00g0054850 [Actinidia rufa]|uniref:Reverse transcriptase Ty1/copia-type domain-containing protein n=1 Tax=Actinidia rufa TaxID=165716 RepID=A0A7J0DNQ8_9ERIC|nr:hypothetical protein Acr_00g0054850 [Actinidia rufa]
MFNSMEDRVYHMFMYHYTVHGLWTALTQMYAHARNESRIFELYREVSHASQTSLELSVADFFGYLQTRWEELAQYKPLSDFPSDGAVESKRLDRRHTYQFLMGLKSEFETLRTQILNTSPLPSLYEAFAIVDGDERRRRILPSLSLPESSSIVPDQRAFAAASGTHLYCQHCRKPGHLIDRCWVLHPELKQQFSRPRGGGRGGGRSGLQIAQLQSHLGLATASQSSGPTAAIVAETPTALHGPDFEEDFWQGMSRFWKLFHFFSNSTPNPGSEILAADEPIPPRPLPILEPTSPTPTPNGSLSPIASQDPGPPLRLRLPCQHLLRSQVDSISIPRSVHEALQNPLWVSAMKAEMEALQRNRTWDLIALPKGERTVGCKWVFSVKYLADGSVDRYKARLVAKGFTQIPVPLRSYLLLFVASLRVGCIIISVYVDDIIITGDDASGIVQVKCGLRKAFDIKDLGPLRYFLGIEVARSRHAIMLSSDSVLHERTKHIEVDIHFIREKVRSGVITPSFVSLSTQIADMFTKSIGPSLLKSSLVKLGLVDIFALA